MDREILDSVAEDLFRVLPVIHRRLLKVDLETVNKDISRHHYAIMRMLDELGTVHVSAVGRSLMVSKPQMTHSVDRLIRLGMVERRPDTVDRRMVHLSLTSKGRAVLEECHGVIRASIRTQLSALNDEELEDLSAALRKVAEIGSRLA